MRNLSYPDTHVFILCFSVIDRVSLNNVINKWIPELHQYRRKSKIMLVGTQTDERDEKNIFECSFITDDEGGRVAIEVKASSYISCSALKNFHVKEVFERAISLASQNRSEPDCWNVFSKSIRFFKKK
jgi:GTPase SAR1 family protein